MEYKQFMYGLQFFGFIGNDLVHLELKKTLFTAKGEDDVDRILGILCKDVEQAHDAYYCTHSYTGTGILCDMETLEREAVLRFIKTQTE